MGNISNTWYLKDSGGDWASTKCELDDCYSIPFDGAHDDLYLQAELPEGIWVDKIWLCDLDGIQYVDVKAITDWKIIEGDDIYHLIFRVPNNLTCVEGPVSTGLDCFRFEIPLISVENSTVVNTLVSEPFHCPVCEPTVKISSDYCISRADIFGTFIFNPAGFGTTHYGGLTSATNDFRIQAVLKQLPSQLAANRNLRCFTYRSKLQQRYKLQGALTDFPDYMVSIIESIFSGKRIFIDDEEYLLNCEELFMDRHVEGRSMKRLEVELVKCELDRVHECECGTLDP